MIRTNCQVKDHFPGKHIGMQKKEVANKLVSGQMIGAAGRPPCPPANCRAANTVAGSSGHTLYVLLTVLVFYKV